MKKRTGAQSAMAELLSKSNETQIKDKGTPIHNRIPEANFPKAEHSRNNPRLNSVPRNGESIRRESSPKRTQHQRPIPDAVRADAPARQRPISHNSGKPINESISRKTVTRSEERKAPAPRIPYDNASIGRHSSSGINGAERRQSVQNQGQRSPRTIGSNTYPRERVQTSPSQIKPAIQPTKRSNVASMPAARRKKKTYVPVKAIITFTAVILLAVAVTIAVTIISKIPKNVELIPEISCGSKPIKISSSAPFIQLSSSKEQKDRHTVTVEVFEGEKVVCSTEATTVGDILEKMAVEVSEDHVLRPETQDAIVSDTVINYDKITYGTETSTASVPYDTKYIDVQNIPRGSTKITQNGKNGISTATYKITYVNGVETERVLESEVITTYPTNQVVTRGVGGTVTIGGKAYSYSYYIDCKTTVYTGGGITASGLPATENVIAVDPRVIPLGTKVFVSDPYCYVGIRTAADTGGNIKGNFIDIYFDEDNPNLWGYGVRSARVYILD